MSASLKTKLNTLAGLLSPRRAEEGAGASSLEGICRDLQFQHTSIHLAAAGTGVPPAGARACVDDGVCLAFRKNLF